MSEKTEDQIAREREAVQRMVGAKGAMELALNRISRLESALKNVIQRTEIIAQEVGDGILVNCSEHDSGYDRKPVSLKAALRRITKSAGDIL
jgi:hypothetical protein